MASGDLSLIILQSDGCKRRDKTKHWALFKACHVMEGVFANSLGSPRVVYQLEEEEEEVKEGAIAEFNLQGK